MDDGENLRVSDMNFVRGEFEKNIDLTEE